MYSGSEAKLERDHLQTPKPERALENPVHQINSNPPPAKPKYAIYVSSRQIMRIPNPELRPFLLCARQVIELEVTSLELHIVRPNRRYVPKTIITTPDKETLHTPYVGPLDP